MRFGKGLSLKSSLGVEKRVLESLKVKGLNYGNGCVWFGEFEPNVGELFFEGFIF